MLTVKELLYFLNLAPYTHIVVKVYQKGIGLCGLGGGNPDSISNRFGAWYVSRTYVLEEKFYIVVKEF